MKRLFSKLNKKAFASYLIVIAAYVIIQILSATGNLSATLNGLLIPICSYVVCALALNLLVGYLGDLCLGQAGFMAVGAFMGIVGAAYFSRFIDSNIIVLILSLLVGAICASFFGLIIGIPVLKLDGDYLAIVTLAFCQIIKSLLLN